MPLSAIVYTSKAYPGISAAELDDILVDAMARNRLVDVTGALLFDGHYFLQYLEGPKAGVDAAFERIRASSRHTAVRELYRSEVDERYFWKWTMACKHVNASVIQKLEAARWEERLMPHLAHDSQLHDGLGLLRTFWSDGPVVA